MKQNAMQPQCTTATEYRASPATDYNLQRNSHVMCLCMAKTAVAFVNCCTNYTASDDVNWIALVTDEWTTRSFII